MSNRRNNGRFRDLEKNILECCNVKPWVKLSSLAQPSWVGLGDLLNNHHGAMNHWNIHDGIPILQDFRKPIRSKEHGKCDVTFKSQRPTYDDRMALGPDFFWESRLPCERKSCFFFGTFSTSKGPNTPHPNASQCHRYIARWPAWLCWIMKGWWWYGGYWLRPAKIPIFPN